MAIVFSKDIPVNKLLMAYNNNVVRFSSDSALVPRTAQITGLGIDVVLYPHPGGTFYFNFKEYVAVEINTKNFADDLAYDLNSSDANTFTYDVADGCYLEGVVTFKINFTNDTNETATRNLHFITGVEQLENYKKNEILFATNHIIVLSPVAERTNNTTYLKYWEGYPFEFSFYNREYPVAAFTLKNNSNGLSYAFNSKSKVTSMFLSDGRTDVTLENFLPLVIGQNDIQFLVDDVNQNINLLIDKADSDCGIYIKFLNKYGRFNYWLLSKNHFRNRSSKYLGEIENDFENPEDTTSPTLQIGKVGDEALRGAAEKLNENEKLLFEELIDSPKIYYFTGERFAKADHTDWMEVRLKTNSFQTQAPGKKLYSYHIEFDLPARNTITL
jgi:hypothetical protein